MTLTKNNTTNATLVSLLRLHLTVFAILALYFGQTLLIPFALAILLTFILSPFVTILERFLGRIIAVILTFIILFVLIGSLGYLLSKQLTNLGNELPKYKVNIEKKLDSIELSKNTSLTALFSELDKIKSHLPGQMKNQQQLNLSDSKQVNVLKAEENNFNAFAKNFAVILLDSLTSTSLVFLLLVFMLFKRENMRGRLIRLIGPHRMRATTLAMDDAGERITHYLISQLLVNSAFGIVISCGLFIIGVPNAILWGSLAMILRFIPYIGVWIASILPFLVAIAVSPNWTMPLCTFLLFVILDLVTGNIIEPLLFASKTGVSSLALILSAVFWTLLWGPVGLLLSTPLTVCLAVLGLHIPKLSFLNILLSDDNGIDLYEEFHQSLINLDSNETSLLINNYLKKNNIITLFDSTIIPLLNSAEIDRRNEILDENKLHEFNQNILMILDDVYPQSIPTQGEVKEKETDSTAHNYHILCLSTLNEKDNITSNLLAYILKESSFNVSTTSYDAKSAEFFDQIEAEVYNIICISVVPPYLLLPIKKSIRAVRRKFPAIKIVIGLWGVTGIDAEAEQSLKNAGANCVVYTLKQAQAQIEKMLDVNVT